jgi:hypothetical protein
MKLKMSGAIYGGTPTTLLQNFIISLTHIPQNPLYGSRTSAPPTKSESLVGSCSWIDSMLETYSKEKKHKLEGNNYNCVLCHNNREETTFHLSFFLSFQLNLLEHPQHPLELYN